MKVFISRNLKPDSFFERALSERGFEVIGQSLIDFSPVPFELPEGVDWLFFYSRKGVEFFFEKIKVADLPKVKVAAIGEATAGELRQCGVKIHFVGNGEPKATATAFLEMATGQKVVFPQAQNSRRSIQHLLAEKIESRDLVVYRNLPKREIELPDCEVLAFTSPMNVEAYFSKKKIREGQRIAAIGETTASALRELGIEKVEVAPEASEKGLVARIVNP